MVLSIFIGKIIYDKLSLSKNILFTLIPLLLLLTILAYKPTLIFERIDRDSIQTVRRAIYFLISVPSLLLITYIVDCANHYTLFKNVMKILSFIGGITLELYMLHEYICLEPMRRYLGDHYLTYMLSFIVAIALASLLREITRKIVKVK